MQAAPVKVPAIDGWPYEGITAEFDEFQVANAALPGALLVGISLWCLLHKSLEYKRFFVYDSVPIILDLLGILEPNEFMFVRD